MKVKPILFGVFLLCFIGSISSGRYSLSLQDYGNFFNQFINYLKSGIYPSPGFTILFGIRLPRILLALSIGAGLSMAGLIFQQLFKNPIASPDILGVSSGASFGAALALFLAINVQLVSFLFGLLAVFLVYSLKRASKNENILYLVLSGIIVSAFFSALLSLVKYLADPYQQLPSIVFWTMGSLAKANWTYAILCFIMVFGIGLIYQKLSYKISILSVDEPLAKTMGIHVTRLRNLILLLTAFMVAMCVSIVGVVGWISLIVPHVTRLLLKNDRKLTLYTGIIGGIALMVIDTLARSLTSSEIPVGIITSLIGAPILGYLIMIKKTI